VDRDECSNPYRYRRFSSYPVTPRCSQRQWEEQLVVAGTEPGERASRHYFPARHRGWIVDANLLDLDNLDDEFVATPADNTPDVTSPAVQSPAVNAALGVALYPSANQIIGKSDFE